ncbi:MAG: lamin tail domain-containing protein [Saprospiraceae bacterium]|nr:lamin tail domain-containing protein [Saprospiraceae bacterium]
MQWWIAVALITLAQWPARAQFQDDFSDGNLTSDPVWTGDTQHFTVNAQQELQLNAPMAGTSRLWTVVAFPDSVQWAFDYRMDFAPSASNMLRCYLMIDTIDLAKASGYYVEIGQNGADDNLHFYVLDEGSATLLGSTEGIFGSDPSAAQIAVTRRLGGNWEVTGMVAGSGSTALSLTDETFLPAQARHFGLACTYSDTRKDKFFFDNFVIDRFTPDTTPPVLIDASTSGPQALRLAFDEPLLAMSVMSSNVTVSGGIGPAASTELVTATELAAAFTSPFADGATYEVQVAMISDLHGNTAALQTAVFTYREIADPQALDIRINELMPDPVPPVGLPEYEYVELWNVTRRTFDLAGCVLQVGSGQAILPAFLLEPGQLVILTDNEHVDAFAAFGQTLGIDLPALTNTGASVSLRCASGRLVDQVSYSNTWYRDPARDDGGWSLELINPMTPCLESENWRAASNLVGGTPGQINSVLDTSFVDSTGPVLVNLFAGPSGAELTLTFNERLADEVPEAVLAPPVEIDTSVISGRQWVITLSTPLSPATAYRLRLSQVRDCLGNTTQVIERDFGLAEPPTPGDLLVNELLFNPQTGGVAFVELYNASSKFLSTDDLHVVEMQGTSTDLAPVTAQFLIPPGALVVITPDPGDVISRYPTHDPDVLVANPLPSFDRQEATVIISDRQGVPLDQFAYSEDLHNALLDDRKGVSLERLSLTAPASDDANWHSAALGAGFATPGRPNSQAIDPGNLDQTYQIINRTFSPDGDGFADLLLVEFAAPPPGSLATITVYDAGGREINRIMRSELIGAGSLGQWDGTTFETLQASTGIYILRIEILNPDGARQVFKEVVVLATRL